MFRLNGDITRQLENIYSISFNKRFQEELKERILFFLNEKLDKVISISFKETIQKINSYVLLKEEEIIYIKELFFKEYKEELFNSFNPLWYSQKEKEKSYSKKEMKYIVDKFLYEKSLGLKDSFVPLLFAGPKNPDEKDDKFKVSNIIYSDKILKEIYLKIEEILYMELRKDYFRVNRSNLLPVLIITNFINEIKVFDQETIEQFIMKMSRFIYQDQETTEFFMETFFRIYYIYLIFQDLSVVHLRNKNNV